MRAFGLVAVIVALGVTFFVFNRSAKSGAAGELPPQQQVDTVAVRQELLAIAQTERQYLVTHGSYATLEQLAQEDLLPGGTVRRGYTFTAVANGGEHFTITATPSDPGKAGWPTLQVTERMEVAVR